ncbi:MAG: hypothetical protein Q9181_007624, partial [Wetmoreana brouardii]
MGSKRQRVAVVPNLLLIAITDAWLNFSTSTVQYTTRDVTSKSHSTPDSFAPGRGLPSPCLDYPGSYDPEKLYDNTSPIYDCLYQEAQSDGTGPTDLVKASEYAKILANRSDINVIYSKIEGSMILPAKPPAGTDFEATTFGSTTSCETVTDSCDLHWNTSQIFDQMFDDILYDCRLDGANFNLSGNFTEVWESGGIRLNNYNDSTMSSPTNTLVGDCPILWYTLAFTTAADSISNIDTLMSNKDASMTDSWSITTKSGLVFLQRQYQHYSFDNGTVVSDTWNTMNNTAPFLFVTAIQVVEPGQLQEGIRTGVAGADKVEDIASGFARVYDQPMLALVADRLPGRPPLSITESSTSQVTRIPQVPFVTLIVLDLLYATCGTCLMIAALIAVRTGSGVKDVQARLSTLAVVAESFENPAWGDDAKNIDMLFAERRGKTTRRVALTKRSHGGRKFKQVVMPHTNISSGRWQVAPTTEKIDAAQQ